jgi:hypothetical protein
LPVTPTLARSAAGTPAVWRSKAKPSSSQAER